MFIFIEMVSKPIDSIALSFYFILFYFILLRNVMNWISYGQACNVQ